MSAGAAPGHASANAPSAMVKAPVPASLTDTESAAEDLVDLALAGDRGGVVAKAATLEADANGPAAASLTKYGVPPAKIAQLRQRADRVAQLSRGGSFVAVALAANAVSQLMPDLYGHFQNPVPALIFALDYLDREAQLRAIARQPEKVATAVQQLARTWSRVRARVVAAGGAKEAAAYGKHVAAMKRLGPHAWKRIQAEAVNGLNLVDELENVFAR